MTIWNEGRLLINGELVAAENGATYENYSPSTEEAIGVAADAILGDVRRAIGAARKAFDTTDWPTNRELRVRCLRQLHQALVDNAEHLRQILVHEVGMPYRATFGPGLDSPTNSVKWYADTLETYEFTDDLGVAETIGGLSRRTVEKEAAGVVAAIVAYNYPLQLAPALAAGCTVVLKGAPQTPWSALALGRLIAENTDIPADVVNVISSSAAEVSAELTTSRDVDLVTFTGSTPVGKKIMAAASDTVKRVFLELGGKSAMVVLDDANLDLAVMATAFAITSHAGQGCSITTRMIVPRAQYDEIAARVTQTLQTVKVGAPGNPETYMGPLISAEQRAKVAGYVDRAIAAGAKAEVAEHALDGLDTFSVNGGVYYNPDAPFGGYKQSGFGREMGVASFDEFLERKTIAEPA